MARHCVRANVRAESPEWQRERPRSSYVRVLRRFGTHFCVKKFTVKAGRSGLGRLFLSASASAAIFDA